MHRNVGFLPFYEKSFKYELILSVKRILSSWKIKVEKKMKRRESLKPAAKKTDELPWDFFDRCLLPIIFSHAAAIIVSFVLNILRISQISSFSLFIVFVLITVSVTICYHNLQVSLLFLPLRFDWSVFVFRTYTKFEVTFYEFIFRYCN